MLIWGLLYLLTYQQRTQRHHAANAVNTNITVSGNQQQCSQRKQTHFYTAWTPVAWLQPNTCSAFEGVFVVWTFLHCDLLNLFPGVPRYRRNASSGAKHLSWRNPSIGSQYADHSIQKILNTHTSAWHCEPRASELRHSNIQLCLLIPESLVKKSKHSGTN